MQNSQSGTAKRNSSHIYACPWHVLSKRQFAQYFALTGSQNHKSVLRLNVILSTDMPADSASLTKLPICKVLKVERIDVEIKIVFIHKPYAFFWCACVKSSFNSFLDCIGAKFLHSHYEST